MKKQKIIFGLLIISAIGILLTNSSIFAHENINSKNDGHYINYQLGFSVSYPVDWVPQIYKSNGYEAFGLFDDVSRKQNKNIPDLVQGAKIEILINGDVPQENLKTYLARSIENFASEKVVDQTEVVLPIYPGTSVTAVRDEIELPDGGRALRISFIGMDNRLYMINLLIPKDNSASPELQEYYEKVLDKLVFSFKFKE